MSAIEPTDALKNITILNPDMDVAAAKLTLPEGCTITGYEPSTAKIYADENDIPFISLGKFPTYTLGDVNEDTLINASDAAQVLIAAASIGAGNEGGLTENQMLAANVNGDENVNASDAAIILVYAAALGAGDTDAKITDYVK